MAKGMATHQVGFISGWPGGGGIRTIYQIFSLHAFQNHHQFPRWENIRLQSWQASKMISPSSPSPGYGVSPPSVGQGGCDPPWRFQTKRRRAYQERPADCSRRVLAIGGIIFGHRSIFDPVMSGQRTIFLEILRFFNFTNPYQQKYQS